MAQRTHRLANGSLCTLCRKTQNLFVTRVVRRYYTRCPPYCRTRPEHQKWNGIILPVNHPFWNTHLPPNDYGCRCTVIQTDDTADKHAPEADSIKDVFKNNPAKTGKLWHEIVYEKNFTDKQELRAIRTTIREWFAPTLNKIKRANQFFVKYQQGQSTVTQHILVDTTKSDYEEVLEVATAFANQGKQAELLPEINAKDKKLRNQILQKYKQETKNPDLRVDGKYYDVKAPENIERINNNANKASKQGCIAIIHNKHLKLDADKIERESNEILKSKGYKQNEVYFYSNGKLNDFNNKIE